jgi:hypothetical protein
LRLLQIPAATELLLFYLFQHSLAGRLAEGSATVVEARIDGREQPQGRPVEAGPAAGHHLDEAVVDEAAAGIGTAARSASASASRKSLIASDAVIQGGV